eukprot:4212029-Pleurochrysis_carterae.AAC.2
MVSMSRTGRARARVWAARGHAAAARRRGLRRGCRRRPCCCSHPASRGRRLPTQRQTHTRATMGTSSRRDAVRDAVARGSHEARGYTSCVHGSVLAWTGASRA